MIRGVQKLVVEVEDQDRALRLRTDAMRFEIVRDTNIFFACDDLPRTYEEPRARGVVAAVHLAVAVLA